MSREIVPILFGIFFGSAILGYFGLAGRIMRQPLSIFSDAISRSFFHEIADANRNNHSYTKKVNDLFHYLFLLGMVPIIIFSIVAPEFIGVIFGKGWESAGIYISLLAFPIFSNFIYRPLSIVFDIQERQALRFWVTLFRFAAATVSIFLGATSGSPVLTLFVYASTIFVIDIGLSFLLLVLVNLDLFQIVKQTLIKLFLFLLPTAPVIWARFSWASKSPVLFIIWSAIIMILFYVSVARFDQKLNYLLRNLFFAFNSPEKNNNPS